jgi:GTP-binding protein
MNSEFVISATGKENWPPADLPEVVVVGRSNVGKSSFINAFTGKKRLAYVGNTPGKTRLLNFFAIDGQWSLVDVPGYGYAKMSKSALLALGKMMDEYFTERENIKCVIQLVDARHLPTTDDLDMAAFFKEMNIPMIVAATKIDKVPKTKRIAHLKQIANAMHIPLANVLPVSSTEFTGLKEVEERIRKQLELE